MLYLSAFGANGVLNPAVAFSMGVSSTIWPDYTPNQPYYLPNSPKLTMVKTLSPLFGGLLAGLFFIMTRKQLEKKEGIAASNDILRGSFFVNNVSES